MADTGPRFEFRVFGTSLGMAEQRMRDIAPCESIIETMEIYLLGHRIGTDRNVKIRHGSLELKRLIEHHRGLQRWQPAGQWEFPVARAIVENLLIPAHALSQDHDPTALLSLEDLLLFTAQTATQLVRANVFKRRFRYTLPACRAEFDQLLVNGAAIESIAIESRDPQAILESRSVICLEHLENQSYPLALSRILGIKQLPYADEFG